MDSESSDALSDADLETVWLPLDQWRLETGFTNLSVQCIRDYYVGPEKGVRNYNARRFYKILPDSLHTQEADAEGAVCNQMTAVCNQSERAMTGV